MKIQELRFKNLNSLYGEWRIDFTAPAYTANGIFAITGPTGAGKTTILDALCLALFGTTPRLGRITKGGNEVMSRQTGECFAEVVFESAAGVYRCTWSQHRARGRANGNLLEASHEIADARTGQVLEAKKTATVAMIEEKTGMDMDRFTRSILLAQGGFAAFLQATPSDRAPILEQITGTEIYSNISIRVYERQKAARAELDLLQAEIRGITLLGDEQEQEKAAVLAGLQLREQALADRIRAQQGALAWLQGMASLENQLAAIAGEETTIAARLVQFQPERTRLETALRAAELDGEFAALNAQRRQSQQEEAALACAQAQLPDMMQNMSRQSAALAAAAAATASAKAEQQQAAPLITATRTLDIQIDNLTRQMATGQLENQELIRQLNANQAARDQLVRQQATAIERRDRLTRDMANHAADEMLVTQLAGIKEKLANLLGLAGDRAVNRQMLAKAQAHLTREKASGEALRQAGQTMGEACQAAQALANQARAAMQRHLGDHQLREYRAEQAGLLTELALRQKIASLEEERHALADGKPCPLCGSTVHPYAAGNVPALNETRLRIDALREIIATAESLEEQAKDSDTRLNQARIAWHEWELQQAKADDSLARAAEEISRLTDEQKALADRYDRHQAALLSELQPLGITDLPAERLQVIATGLQDRRQRWLNWQQDDKALEDELRRQTVEINRLDSLKEPLEQARAGKGNQLAGQAEERVLLAGRRFQALSEKNPDLEEKRLAENVSLAEAGEAAARESFEQSKAQTGQLQSQIAQHEANLRQWEPILATLEQAFAVSLTNAGFKDEAAYQAGSLTASQRKDLAAQAKQLDDRRTDLANRRKDRESSLAIERNRQLTTETLPELTAALRNNQDEMGQIGRDIGAIQQELAGNARNKATLQQRLVQIEARQETWQRWSKLNELIGSAEGKKFRNFAQGITFELLVAHANRQLEKLTDRYLLTPNSETPLELNVVDNYQAGEERSTKNLSGGESFIVSLALALGLSHMASSKVRVDSLFLDEGFGTLDEDTLETALETLASLQQDGKLIGIISHVPALKERISTQLVVTPVSGGRSVITGPGVSRG